MAVGTRLRIGLTLHRVSRVGIPSPPPNPDPLNVLSRGDEGTATSSINTPNEDRPDWHRGGPRSELRGRVARRRAGNPCYASSNLAAASISHLVLRDHNLQLALDGNNAVSEFRVVTPRCR